MTLWSQAVFSFMGTLGFAVLYNVPRKALLACSIIGMGAYTLRGWLQLLGMNYHATTFLGALFVGLLGLIPAKRLHLPPILFAITGIICMVPGIAAFKVVIYFSHGDIAGGLNSAIEAGFGIGALAAGIGMARVLTDPEWGFERD